MPKLNLNDITIQNFRSFGDYPTKIQINGLGPVLILGQINDTSKSNGSGKCLDEDTLILSANGELIKIKDLAGKEGIKLACIDRNYKNSVGTLKKHIYSGEKECFLVETELNRQLICTKEHLLKSFECWRQLKDLKVGDYIATTRNISEFTNEQSLIEIEESELIGLLLGDGHFGDTPTLCISKKQPKILSRLKYLLNKIDPTLKVRASDKNRTALNYRICANEHSPRGGYKENPIKQLLMQLDLLYKVKSDKFIPMQITNSNKDVIQACIIGLWATDGTINVGKTKPPRQPHINIEFSNKSESICRSLQHLLLKFDIRARIRRKQALCTTTGKRHDIFILNVSSKEKFLTTFRNSLCKYGFESLIIRALSIIKKINGAKYRSNNKDLVPGSVWNYIDKKIGNNEWFKSAPTSIHRNRSIYVKSLRDTSREIIEQFGLNLNDEYLTNLGTSDIYWDRIKYIKPIGVRKTYDLQMECDGEPNFFANDIIVHNSSIADAITWCLFGRLPSKDKPSDNVINHFTNGECKVIITTTDGYAITRTRKPGSTGDLLIHSPTGEDITDSTNTNAQQHLYKLFNLDYDIFTSSVFFGQFNRPFLELPDLKRKRALERVLGLDKFDHYADVAKEKIGSSELEQQKYKGELEQLEKEIYKLSQHIEENTDERRKFEESRSTRITQTREELGTIDQKYADKSNILSTSIRKLMTELGQIQLHDIDKLDKEWESYQNKINSLDVEDEKLSQISNQILKLESEKETLSEDKDETDYDRDIEAQKNKLKIIQAEISESTPPDISSLTTSWDRYLQIEEKIKLIADSLQQVRETQLRLESEEAIRLENIKEWEDKIGKVCPTCKQVIDGQHVHAVTSPEEIENNKIKIKIEENEKERKTLEIGLNKLKSKLIKPDMTLTEAQLIIKNYDAKQKEINSITDLIENLQNRKEKSEQEMQKREERIKNISASINDYNKSLDDKRQKLSKKRKLTEQTKPTITANEARLIKKQYDAKNSEIKMAQSAMAELDQQKEAFKESVRKKIKDIEDEHNPYDKIITNLNNRLTEIKKERSLSLKTMEECDSQIRHMDYIKSAYSDRRKIKAHMLSNLIPYFNERIAYYLDSFECGFSLEFNAFLQTKSDKWPYDMWSGGEKKRIDLAIMFAIHDLHTSIYDQQCNILVLDEVDGRLDSDGINALVNLLFKDFVPSGKNILVISHKDEMRDVFPTKILVKKINDLSMIEEIR